MKKAFFAILCVCILLIYFPVHTSFEAEAKYAMPSDLCDIHNIDLAYTFYIADQNNLRQTVASFLPKVAYLSTDGKILDTFMDSHLFLPCVSYGPSGGTMYRTKEKKPGIASDWIAYLDDLFTEGYNVDALNATAKMVGDALGQPDLKLKIFFSALYPNKFQTDFGSLDGENTLNFCNASDRAQAVKWMVDEEIRRFEAMHLDHLELVGFYWFEESIETEDPAEKTLVQYFNNYVHSLGYKSIWIPYNWASGWNVWKSYGFDVACMQPNLMWQKQYNESIVTDCISRINQYGMCMEVEMDGNVFSTKYNYYLAYLREGARMGVNKGIKMYYQGGAPGTLYYACYSKDERARSVYDLTYLYAKEKLDWRDALPDEDLTVPRGYRDVSLHKPYTATEPYRGDGSVGYQNVDGTELTDGIREAGIFTTAWHGFHISHQEENGGFAITLDLEKVTEDLGYFSLTFGEALSASVGLPNGVTLWISEDGETFEKLAELPYQQSVDSYCVYTYTAKGVTARYVKATFDRRATSYNFIFCSEICVGQIKYKRGDLDKDGILSAHDARLMCGVLAGLEESSVSVADMNGDGFVDSYDGVLLMQYLAGMDG